MIASVVPITRLRRATEWWSYRVPPRTTCVPGSLVVIPFRGRATMGVVWELHEQPDTHATESISEVITEYSLIHAPQRSFIEWLAEYGIISLSTATYIWLPSALRGYPLSKTVVTELAAFRTSSSPQPQQAILLPGERAEIRSYLAQKAHWHTFDPQSELEEFRAWLSVASGKTEVVAGRERALFAPYANLRQITVLNPEDISYYHEQIPYISLVRAAQAASTASLARFSVKTYLPGEAAAALWNSETPSPELPGNVVLQDILGTPMLYPALLEKISRCLIEEKRAILLLNAYDQEITLEDGTRSKLPGIQTVRNKLLAHLSLDSFPEQIVLGTRSILSQRYTDVGLTAVLSLDPLLRQTTFADTLHGLADVATLLSYSAPCFVYAHDRSHPLVQALRNHRFSEYCTDFVHDQQTAALPPFSEQVVCSHPEHAEVQSLFERLQKIELPEWQVSYPNKIRRRKQDLYSISLHAPQHTRLPQPIRAVLAALPRPWKVEHNPWFTI